MEEVLGSIPMTCYLITTYVPGPAKKAQLPSEQEQTRW
jgi:hypothetical protein